MENLTAQKGVKMTKIYQAIENRKIECREVLEKLINDYSPEYIYYKLLDLQEQLLKM